MIVTNVSVIVTNVCHLQGGGVHGNGLLTKFDVSDARLVHHRYKALHTQHKKRLASYYTSKVFCVRSLTPLSI